MRAIAAQLAGGERNADRVFVSDDAVVVLDGATAYEPVDLDPGAYAEFVGREIVRRLGAAPIVEAVSGAIEATVRAHDLEPGRSPSSTVSVLRVRDDEAELYVLGDSPIYYGAEDDMRVLRDDRLDKIASIERAAYVDGLRAGHGYTEYHQRVLAALQREQRRHRNRPSGYWIAEADPQAAQHAFVRTISRGSISWAVLGSDGATDLIAGRSGNDWREIANYSSRQLRDLLVRLHEWERDNDPHGCQLPRAKRHDDKTLVAVPDVFS